jgi:hypothetical protein
MLVEDSHLEFVTQTRLAFPIVTRQKATDPIWCPYCDRKHIHGTADGHRNSHCATIVPKRRLYIKDEIIDSSHGYFIRTLNK